MRYPFVLRGRLQARLQWPAELLLLYAMEPVTHFLAGACLSRAGLNRKAAYATVATTLAAEAPDIDVLWSLLGPLKGFEHHRGITHTLAGAPFVALSVTITLWLWHSIFGGRREHPAPLRWGLLFLFAWLGVLLHIFMDWTNDYGVRPFAPWNPRWFSGDLVFIFDPLLFLVLLAMLLLPWIFGLADREIGVRKTPFRSRAWALTALSFMLLYWMGRGAEHHRALQALRSGLLTDEPQLKIAAEPSPLSPFHWYLLAETKNYYLSGYYSTFSDRIEAEPPTAIYHKPPVTSAVVAAKVSKLGRIYLDWSSFPITEDLGPVRAPGDGGPQPNRHAQWTAVRFHDLRFGYQVLGRTPDPDLLSGWIYVFDGNEPETVFLSGREDGPD